MVLKTPEEEAMYVIRANLIRGGIDQELVTRTSTNRSRR